MSLARTALSAAVAALGAGLALPQSTWHVDVNATPPGDGSPGSPYASIQHALDQPTTVDGDTILVAPGTYVETVEYGGKSVRIASVAGPAETVIEPADPAAPWVVRMDALTTTLEGFRITRSVPGTGTQTGVVGTGSGESFQTVCSCVIEKHARGLVVGYTGFIDRCTVAHNEYGAWEGGQIIVASSVFEANSVSDVRVGAFGYPGFYSYSNIDMSDVHNAGNTVTGVIDVDPRLWDVAGGDYRPRPDSPCIDAGDPNAPPDPDGSRRDMGAFTYDPFWAPRTKASCFGSAAACPCGNGGSGEGGCDIAQGTGGVALAVRDFTPDGAGGGSAVILGSGYPPNGLPGVTLIRSRAAEDPPVVFGDGLRCIASTGLVRVRTGLAAGGSIELALTHGAGGGTFHYQLWNRNTPISFCDPTAAFNLSNALEIVWP